LCWFWPWGNWVCFAKNRAICRGVSTTVERPQGKATDLGVGECLGLGSYDENLALWYLLLTTDYMVLAIGRSVFTIDY